MEEQGLFKVEYTWSYSGDEAPELDAWDDKKVAAYDALAAIEAVKKMEIGRTVPDTDENGNEIEGKTRTIEKVRIHTVTCTGTLDLIAK